MNKDWRMKIKKRDFKSRFNFCNTFINNKECNNQDEELLKL